MQERHVSGLAPFRRVEMRLSRAAPVLVPHCGFDAKYSGEEGTLLPAFASIFGLRGKAERSAGTWQHRGTHLAALHEHLPMGVR